jgi:hypothetical protein
MPTDEACEIEDVVERSVLDLDAADQSILDPDAVDTGIGPDAADTGLDLDVVERSILDPDAADISAIAADAGASDDLTRGATEPNSLLNTSAADEQGRNNLLEAPPPAARVPLTQRRQMRSQESIDRANRRQRLNDEATSSLADAVALSSRVRELQSGYPNITQGTALQSGYPSVTQSAALRSGRSLARVVARRGAASASARVARQLVQVSGLGQENVRALAQTILLELEQVHEPSAAATTEAVAECVLRNFVQLIGGDVRAALSDSTQVAHINELFQYLLEQVLIVFPDVEIDKKVLFIEFFKKWQHLVANKRRGFNLDYSPTARQAYKLEHERASVLQSEDARRLRQEELSDRWRNRYGMDADHTSSNPIESMHSRISAMRSNRSSLIEKIEMRHSSDEVFFKPEDRLFIPKGRTFDHRNFAGKTPIGNAKSSELNDGQGQREAASPRGLARSSVNPSKQGLASKSEAVQANDEVEMIEGQGPRNVEGAPYVNPQHDDSYNVDGKPLLRKKRQYSNEPTEDAEEYTSNPQYLAASFTASPFDDPAFVDVTFAG